MLFETTKDILDKQERVKKYKVPKREHRKPEQPIDDPTSRDEVDTRASDVW